MKKKISILLLAVAASVGTMFASTKIGDLYYNLDATNQTAEVTYKSYYNYKYNEGWGITTAIIPASVTYSGTTYSVTSIGGAAFQDCTGLTSVTIPNSVTSIGLQAFNRCTGLTSITIGSGVTSCGQNAFNGCTSLTAVHISDLAAWCNISFSGGSNPLECAHNLYLNGELVTDLIIPNGVTSIGYKAFRGCTSLTSITIPSSVTSIGVGAFYGCTGLTSVTINSNAIMSKTYTNSDNIKNIFGDQVAIYTIGTDVTSIGDGAFYECTGLTSVTIGNSVTSIGGAAFRGCSGLTSVTIPNSVTSIGVDAFRGCSSLTSVTIPNSVTSIGAYAFDGCNLTSVTIPNSVTSIEKNAFSGCTSLTSVTIPNSVTSIGQSAFYGCAALTSVTIPNSVTAIGLWAFHDCSGLTSVTIGNSVTSIGISAFQGCSGLTSVTIPNSVTSIGDDAFWGCTGLTSVTCNAITPPSCASRVFNGVNCNMIPLHVPEQSISVYKSTSPWNGFNPIISTNKFIIKYVNWDGSVLQNAQVEEGKMPTYTGATPVRAEDETYTYSFSGWSPTIVAATADADYTAQFTATKKTIGGCADMHFTWLATGANDMGEITTTNAEVWTWDSKYGAIGSKSGGVTAWLLTPIKDLSGMENITLSFSHVHRYAGTFANEMTLWICANYQGSVETSSWQQLTISPYASNTNWTYVGVTVEVPENKVGERTVFGFKYMSTETNYAKWEIKDLHLDAQCSESPTAIENTSNQVQDKVRKVLRNGQIFILRGDKTYTLQGQEVN